VRHTGPVSMVLLLLQLGLVPSGGPQNRRSATPYVTKWLEKVFTFYMAVIRTHTYLRMSCREINRCSADALIRRLAWSLFCELVSSRATRASSTQSCHDSVRIFAWHFVTMASRQLDEYCIRFSSSISAYLQRTDHLFMSRRRLSRRREAV